MIAGTADTDANYTDLDDVDFEGDKELFHTQNYRQETVGSALFNALGRPADLSREEIQDRFWKINNYVTSHLSF